MTGGTGGVSYRRIPCAAAPCNREGASMSMMLLEPSEEREWDLVAYEDDEEDLEDEFYDDDEDDESDEDVDFMDDDDDELDDEDYEDDDDEDL